MLFLSQFLLCWLSLAQISQALWIPHERADELEGNQRAFRSRSALSKLRDALVHGVWGPPPLHLYEGSAVERQHRPGSTKGKLLTQYGEDVILRFNVSSIEEAGALSQAVNNLFLDVWDSQPGRADVRVARDVVPSLMSLLPESLRLSYKTLVDDLAQIISESSNQPTAENSPTFSASMRTFNAKTKQTQSDENNIFFRDYQPLSVIHPWMRLLESLFPSHVRLIKIGTSFEGRDILGLRVGVHPTNDEKPSKPRNTIVVTGGLHAREWISVSGVNFAAYSMITSYGKARWLTKLMEEFDWVFIPTLNPDGYVYSWDSDRLWRKNRQATSLRFCRGLDLDRTFPFQWDGESTRGNPCSESYAGESPAEGHEARVFASWLEAETAAEGDAAARSRLVGFLDFHSYSQQVLYPFSYSCIATPPTLENLEELGLGLAKAIRQADSKSYGVTSACEGSVALQQQQAGGEEGKAEGGEGKGQSTPPRAVWPKIEPSGGTAIDYMYHEMGVKYAYQIKLRDKGSYGFLLPPKNIVPTGREVFNAVTYFGTYLLGNKGIETAADEGGFEGFGSEEGSAVAEEGGQEGNAEAPKDSESPEPEIDRPSPEIQGESWELRKR